MIRKIIELSVKNRVLVLLLFAMGMAVAAWAAFHSKLDAVPDLSDVQVLVLTNYPGQSPGVVDCVWEYTLTTSDKAHSPLAPAPRGWPQTPHLRRRSSSRGSTDPVFAAASCIWGLCGQSILIFRRDRALGRDGAEMLHMCDAPVNDPSK